MFQVFVRTLVLCFIIKTSQCQKVVNVEILYESLCPDSLKFINQLHSVWNELSPYLNIKFIPFGKSASSYNGGKFACQHGPRECVGNRIQSCALDMLQDQNAHVEFVYCFMNNFQKGRDLEQTCALRVGLDWIQINSCYTSTKGTHLQLQAEQETKRYSPKFVPTIVYQGKFNQQYQDLSVMDLKTAACTFINDVNRANVCQSPTVLFI